MVDVTQPAAVTAASGLGPTGGRGVFQIHPSRHCNLRCRHCYSDSGPLQRPQLSLEALGRSIADAARLGYGVLGISGGEPLLYPHLVELLRLGKELGMVTTVTSNGTLLSPARLAAIAPWLDGLALSLDGEPEHHATMRRNPRAFQQMADQLPALRAAGIPFGFVFTLTQANLPSLAWVVDFARAQGASLVQIHPLEPEGQAAHQLAAAIPDGRELAFATLETLRLRQELGEGQGPFLQIDVATHADLRQAPQRFLALPEAPDLPLGHWLSPLVLESDGTLVPLTYGFPRPYALGSLATSSLARLAKHWDAEPLLQLARATHAQLCRPEAPAVVNWYQAIGQRAQATPQQQAA